MERSVKTTPGINSIIAGEPWQIRAPRLDAMLRAGLKAQNSLFSREREARRVELPDCAHPACAGSSHCREETKEVRILATAVVLVRWWPLDMALRMAKAFERCPADPSGPPLAGIAPEDAR